jgi:hypothetical protein
VPSRHCAVAFALLRAWRQAPGWMSRRWSSARLRSSFVTSLDQARTAARRRSEVHGDGAGANAAFRPAEPRTTLNHPQGKGREKDVAHKSARSAPPPTASLTSPKPADVQASLEMARPGIEPGTPRFSDGPENP